MSSARFVCPFCPLHCDDLEAAKLVPADQSIMPTHPRAAFGVPSADSIGGEPCAVARDRLDSALAHHLDSAAATPATLAIARQWVEQAEQIWVTGRILDLQTARAVCRFAEQTGAGVTAVADPAATVETAVYCETFARDGGFATTLGDAAAPHVSVILIGDPSQRWPRLRQRLARAGELYAWQNMDRLSERLAHLRRWLRRPDESSPADDPDLAACRELCGRATSVVFVVVPEVLNPGEAILFQSTMTGLLRDLNVRIRAALLRFDETLTFRSVRAWSGQPTAAIGSSQARSSADLVIELVPWGGDCAGSGEMIGEGGAVADGAQPAARRITIGWQPAAPEADSPEFQTCYLPASAGGIGRAATVLRGDGSVALPLRPLVQTVLPAPAEVFGQLTPQRGRSLRDRTAEGNA